MFISCPHFKISIRQRSKRQSAVAGAAYQSGEDLFSEYDLTRKRYRYKAPEVMHKEILLPSNAPPEYKDQQTLWNAAERVEKQWNISSVFKLRNHLSIITLSAQRDFPSMLWRM